MNNKLKRFSAGMLAVATVATMNTTVFAANLNEGSPSGASTVEYTISPDWSVTIPETIVAGEVDTEISITGQANMAAGSKVSVTIDNGDVTLNRYSLDGLTLQEGANADTLEVEIYLGSSKVISNQEVAKFTNGTENGIVDKLVVKGKSKPADKKAGKYKGNVTFTAEVKEIEIK